MRGALLIVTGPTASGKTAFADRVACRCAERQIAVEIINGDVGQLYAPLSIGTAKPDLRAVTVKHHLFDLVDEPVSFSVSAYRRHVIRCMEEILMRGALPIIVGGSMFYIKSLFYPPQDIDQIAAFERVDDAEFEGVETSILWEKLHDVDHARARAISKNDRYRIMRALALWSQTGKPPSSFAPVYDSIAEQVCVVAVTREREDLHRRIDQRVVQMFDEGLLEEVSLLGPRWEAFLREKKLIGYNEVIGRLNDPRHALIAAVQKNTRAYAKRQMTFLRPFLSILRGHPETAVVDANLTLSSDYLYIEQVVAWADEYVSQRTLG